MTLELTACQLDELRAKQRVAAAVERNGAHDWQGIALAGQSRIKTGRPPKYPQLAGLSYDHTAYTAAWRKLKKQQEQA